jgi:hypothetical protein
MRLIEVDHAAQLFVSDALGVNRLEAGVIEATTETVTAYSMVAASPPK